MEGNKQMRIGLLITSIGNFGQKGFYNAQEIGLAKAMDPLADEVIVYKLISENEKKRIELIENCKHASIIFIPAKSYGINGMIDTAVLDKSLDALIYFSDTQFCVPKVFKWARKNNVRFFPYIGVIESHSTSKLKKLFVDWMFVRNLKVYKQCHCFVKTPTVKDELQKIGVNNSTVTPVGLDLSLLKTDYKSYDPVELKKKYGYGIGEKVILFIGRLIEEKQPLRMIEIFSEVYRLDSAYRLLMVGSGEMKEQVENMIMEKRLENRVQLIDRIPNKDIWELYRFANCFVNLNQQEIFGMAILEAMYYGCKVIAWEAPGPSFIIEDSVSGYLVQDDEQIKAKILDSGDVVEEAHNRVVNEFTWDNMARKVKLKMAE